MINVPSWLTEIAAHFERQRLVDKLALLSDHALDDIGLRRDQLDSLRLSSQPREMAKVWTKPVEIVRPSLQGCG